MEYIHIFIATLVSFFSLFWWIFRAKDGYPTNWFFIGMLPGIYKNVNRIHDYIAEVMEKFETMSIVVKGPWFFNMNFLVTLDPVNINYVYSRNFENYGKGPHLREVLNFVGDGIFAAEAELWEYHRKLNHSFFSHPKFQSILFHAIWNETENSLIPLLDHASKNAIQIDLQDVFTRFNVDNICTILMNHNPKFLSIDFPSMPFCEAITYLEKFAATIFLLPQFIWKSVRWLGVGAKKYKKACQTVDDYIYMMIAKKREESKNTKESKSTLNSITTKDNIDKLSYYDLVMADIDEDEIGGTNKKGDKFIKDTILNLIMAGTSTISVVFPWLFYLLSKNPHVTTKIRVELNSIRVHQNEGTTIDKFLKNFSQYKNNLVYLHAVICEILRLYPPGPFNQKAAIKPDILPSGHKLNPDMFILFDVYAMGRMKSIWGDDCVEFKPERWITEQGNIKLEPTYKFLAFSTGPRICPGKDMAFTQLKFLIATLIMKYDVEVVKQNEVAGELSIILHMKHGLNVKIKTRE